MAEDFGTGVSRTLNPIFRQFGPVVFQQQKPPLDSEFNLMGQIELERMAQFVRTVVPSGFFTDPTRALNDFRFDKLNSNLFVFGNPRGDNPNHSKDADERYPVVWANVNGWVIPVAGTNIDVAEGVENIIRLYPPPASDSRIDFVFLEAWTTLVAPNPSTDNKPSASTIWKYGNVQHGGTNLADDLEDPQVRFETTERVQIQYRLRVFGQGVGLGAGVALDVYPDALDDPNVLGQATATTPVGGFQFTNMREELGDPSLWRAGDGDPSNALGTTDGFTYAIPVCAIFRRNSGVYMSVADAGTANQNGAFLRTPSTQLLPNPLTGATTLLAASLAADLAWDAEDVDVDITNLNGSGLEDPNLDLGSTFLVIDGEIIGIDSVDVPNERVHISAGGRGRFGTHAQGHSAGTAVSVYNTRPDGLFADEIALSDILDLRRTINTGDWDYQRLLEHNIAALTRGDLRTAWKQSGTGTTEGVSVHQVDYLQADGSVATPNGTESLDGPDGIRWVWSDGAVMQADVTMLLDDEATLIDNSIGFTSADQFDTTTTWATGPDFLPIGWMNLGGVFASQSWTNGSSIFMHIGGEDGTEGARGTFRDGADREVRFVMPKEYFRAPSPDVTKGNQHPVTLRFLEERALDARPWGETGVGGPDTTYPGPMYPWDGQNFEQPFITLGQVVAGGLKLGSVDPSTFNTQSTALTGTVNVTAGSPSIVAFAGETQFTSEVSVGDYVEVNGTYFLIRHVLSDTLLVASQNAPATVSDVPATKLDFLTLDLGVDFDTAGVWWSKDAAGNFLNDPDQVSNPLLGERRTLWGMLTRNGADPSGRSSELYAVTWGDQSSLGNNGAWRVMGAGSSTAGLTPYNPGTTRVTLYPLTADWAGVDLATGNTLDFEIRSGEHFSDLDGSYQDNTADLCIVLTDIGGDNNNGSPWERTRLNYDDPVSPQPDPNLDVSMPRDATVNDKVAVASKMLVSLSLMYHPGRGGMGRVPDEVVRVSLKDADSTYLRQNKTVIDTTFPNVPDDETVYDPNHVQLWNRLPALGWHAPTAPDYGGNIVGFTEQDREHELFFDKGSKTLVFRPFRDREMTLQALTVDEYTSNGGSLLGESYTYPDAHPKDNLQLFTRTGGNPSTGKHMGIPVPREYMPRFGRQDIPYHVDTAAGSGVFLDGINHLFKDSTDLTSAAFNIIGGADNTTGGNEVTSMFFRTSNPTDYGHGLSGSNITASVVTDFLEGRKTTSIDTAQPFAQEIVDAIRSVNSSDLGKGLKGIQLPPYYGIARLYGVYDARDFEAKGGSTFQADRITPETDPAPNLLRTDQDQQTLFILQDGAKDLTTEDGDHTYIVPSEVIDISRAINYVDGDQFEDYDYIVECVIFGFAKDWINGNNYVLVRAHNGEGGGATGGGSNADGDDPQLEGVHMVIPAPAALNDAMFVAHNRTVYQGDPYMTRHQTTRVTSDYEFRYGRPDQTQLAELNTPIQQFKADGSFVPETPNARTFEVLASMDFYTTLGTGNVGGDLLPGTFMDVGHLELAASSRIPESSTAPQWQVRPRTFSQGQKDNLSRAEAIVHISNHDRLNSPSAQHARMEITKLDGTVVPFEFTKDGNEASISGDVGTDGRIYIDEVSKAATAVYEFVDDFGGTLSPGQSVTVNATTSPWSIPTVLPGAAIEIYPRNQDPSVFENGLTPSRGTLVFDGWVNASGEVLVRATSTVGWQAFETEPDPGSATELATTSYPYGGTALAPGSTVALSYTVTGAQVGDPVTWSWDGVTVAPAAPIQVTAGVSAPDTVTILLVTPTSNTVVASWPSGTWRIGVLHELGSASAPSTNWDINLGFEPFYIRITENTGDVSVTVDNMVETVNTHPDLATSVQAFKVSSQEVVLQAITPGAEGNELRVYVEDVVDNIQGPRDIHVRRPEGLAHKKLFAINFSGGVDDVVNAGDGTTQLRLTGMTERLPLGILLQDSDFLGENPLNDTASAMKTSPAGIRPLQTVLPLTNGGEEFTRFLGAPGALVGMADGTVLEYSPFNETTAPSGAKTLRIYRGGGSAFVMSELNPGGPVDWVSETFSAPLKPVLKGGALVCRAMLVRNFYEEPFDTPFTVSEGDEIQMVVITHGVFGDEATQATGIELSGIISPSGYGEGYAAADRYRVEGRPMFKGYSRSTPDPEEVVLAPFPDES
jgi:hypothetical protein